MPDAFTSLLSALAPALGLPEITVREDDPSCLLVIDDFEVSLRWLPEADMVMMFTVVAPLPLEGREALYAELLDANTFFHGTQGFTLAAREDTGVTLQGVMSMRMLDGSNVAQWVQNFVADPSDGRSAGERLQAFVPKRKAAFGRLFLCASAGREEKRGEGKKEKLRGMDGKGGALPGRGAAS